MSEIKTMVRVLKAVYDYEYACDNCRDTTYVKYMNIALFGNPPIFQHQCPKCKTIFSLHQIYPARQFGGEVDLEDYQFTQKEQYAVLNKCSYYDLIDQLKGRLSEAESNFEELEMLREEVKEYEKNSEQVQK